MKNAMKKLLSVMLVVMMLLSVVPFQAFADGDAATVSTESATAPVFLSGSDRRIQRFPKIREISSEFQAHPRFETVSFHGLNADICGLRCRIHSH